jgi:hypothetical protein
MPVAPSTMQIGEKDYSPPGSGAAKAGEHRHRDHDLDHSDDALHDDVPVRPFGRHSAGKLQNGHRHSEKPRAERHEDQPEGPAPLCRRTPIAITVRKPNSANRKPTTTAAPLPGILPMTTSRTAGDTATITTSSVHARMKNPSTRPWVRLIACDRATVPPFSNCPPRQARRPKDNAGPLELGPRSSRALRTKPQLRSPQWSQKAAPCHAAPDKPGAPRLRAKHPALLFIAGDRDHLTPQSMIEKTVEVCKAPGSVPELMDSNTGFTSSQPAQLRSDRRRCPGLDRGTSQLARTIASGVPMRDWPPATQASSDWQAPENGLGAPGKRFGRCSTVSASGTAVTPPGRLTLLVGADATTSSSPTVTQRIIHSIFPEFSFAPLNVLDAYGTRPRRRNQCHNQSRPEFGGRCAPVADAARMSPERQTVLQI